MCDVSIQTNKAVGTIKPMHAVNNGPKKAGKDQTRGNFELYKAAKIPFARNHDAAFCSAYGGEHTVDISAVFPDFNADPTLESSYDFVVTDRYLSTILEAGTEVFYRLGSKIEHGIKKYGTLPPPDFQKWAVIAEHIIRHYNEGWANGFRMNIRYWEIWNEPDLDADDATNKRCWGGTTKQFYAFYTLVARHLKQAFPHLKIGGPALANEAGAWMDGFLDALTQDDVRVTLDFFSWHIYTTDPSAVLDRARIVRKKLDAAGYTDTESICNEWNYVIDWSQHFVESIEDVISMRGAAYTASVMAAGQNEKALDMLMYYDARISTIWNGLFDFYTLRPRKGYYSFLAFSKLYTIGTQVETKTDCADLYVCAAADGTNLAALLSYYSVDKAKTQKREITVHMDVLPPHLKLYLLDQTHDLEEIPFVAEGDTIRLTLAPDSVVFLSTLSL